MSLSRFGIALGAAALATIVAFGLAPAQGGRAPGSSADLQSLVASEREFAALSVQRGMKAAFLAYLADDGVIFRPTPLNGKKSWEARSDPKASLNWEPAFAEVSAAGDLGYDTGPWELRLPAGADQPPLYGHFVSVWRRPPGATWKLVADLGVSHAKPDSGGLGSGAFVPGPVHEKLPSGSRSDLRKLDLTYSDLTREKGVASAFASLAASDVRLNREGRAPFLGLEAARAALDSLPGSLRFLTGGSRLADSRDLGYSYGIAQRFEPGATATEPAADSCVYLHVWRQNPDKTWKLALEVLNPLPRTGRR